MDPLKAENELLRTLLADCVPKLESIAARYPSHDRFVELEPHTAELLRKVGAALGKK